MTMMTSRWTECGETDSQTERVCSAVCCAAAAVIRVSGVNDFGRKYFVRRVATAARIEQMVEVADLFSIDNTEDTTRQSGTVSNTGGLYFGVNELAASCTAARK